VAYFGALRKGELQMEHKNKITELITADHSDKDTLYLLGGAAMILFGAGLMLSRPIMRRYLGHVKVGSLVGAAFPDIERYMKLRAM
jgi:hypothetical protein